MLDYFELTKGVFVFNNVLNDPENTYSIIKKSQLEKDELFTEWQESEFPWSKSTLDFFETKNLDTPSGNMIQEIRSIFNQCFSIYKNNHLDMEYLKSLDIDPYYTIPVNLEEQRVSGGWGSADILIVDYGDRKFNDGFVNGYHVDRTPFWGASSHGFTLNIYPYDKFDGGGLYFINTETMEKQLLDDGREYYLIDDPVYYEPKAGDAVLFKATHPHAVKEVTNGEKLFIRLFMEAPMPNSYKDEIKSMTLEEINLKTVESRAQCISERRHQVNIFDDIDSIKRDTGKGLKLIIR